MSGGICAAVVTLTLGAGPYAGTWATEGVPVAADGVMATGGYVAADHPDRLYPYDGQEPWLHGYFREIPAYGGYHYFRPYNYRHVLPQSQAAGGWGMPPTLPYSQQFWHRYHDNAVMNEELADPEEPAAPPPASEWDVGSEGAATLSAPIIPDDGVNHATYRKLERIEELKERIRRQEFELRLIQELLERHARAADDDSDKTSRNRSDSRR